MGCRYTNSCGCALWASYMVSGEDAWASLSSCFGKVLFLQWECGRDARRAWHLAPVRAASGIALSKWEQKYLRRLPLLPMWMVLLLWELNLINLLKVRACICWRITDSVFCGRSVFSCMPRELLCSVSRDSAQLMENPWAWLRKSQRGVRVSIWNSV